MQTMSFYNYQERIKREDEICIFIDSIRNRASEISENLYIDKEFLDNPDIQQCIDEVWIYILGSVTKPLWLVCNNIVKEAVSSFVYNIIKHEYDNFVSMGSASSNYWNKMLDARSNLSEILHNQ